MAKKHFAVSKPIVSQKGFNLAGVRTAQEDVMHCQRDVSDDPIRTNNWDGVSH